LILAFVALGFGLRVMNITVWRPIEVPPIGATSFEPTQPNALVLGGDAFYYHHQANALARGDGYVDAYRWANLDGDVQPSASHPPAYSTYLAVWSLLGLDSPQWHRFAGCVLGLVTIVASAGAARRLAGDTAAVAAAAIVAIYPGAWINDTMLLSETLAQAVVACFLYASVRCWKERSMRWAAMAGLAAGVSSVTRNEQIVLFVVLGIMLVFRRGERLVDGLKLATAAGLCGLVVIVPWVGRNLATFDRTTLFTTGIGGALSAASCDETYRGEKLGWYHDCFTGPFPDKVIGADGLPYEVDDQGRRSDESYRDLAPYEQATAYIGDHVGQLPKVVAARIGRLWGWYRPIQTTQFEIRIESRGAWQSWANLAGLYVIEILGVAGLVIMRRRRLPISPAVALIGTATFGAAITFGVARYRCTAEVALMVASAVAIAVWSEARSRRSESGSALGDAPASGSEVQAGRSRDHSEFNPIPPSTTQTTSAATR